MLHGKFFLHETECPECGEKYAVYREDKPIGNYDRYQFHCPRQHRVVWLPKDISKNAGREIEEPQPEHIRLSLIEFDKELTAHCNGSQYHLLNENLHMGFIHKGQQVQIHHIQEDGHDVLTNSTTDATVTIRVKQQPNLDMDVSTTSTPARELVLELFKNDLS